MEDFKLAMDIRGGGGSTIKVIKWNLSITIIMSTIEEKSLPKTNTPIILRAAIDNYSLIVKKKKNMTSSNVLVLSGNSPKNKDVQFIVISATCA